MKNTLFLFLAALAVASSAGAQTTVDSIRAKYQIQAMPDELTLEKTFPVLGNYQLTTEDGIQNVVVSLDPENKGIVWIEGLPEGKIKAYLKRSPATYRIISQKSDSGKDVPEGTVYLDPLSNSLNIALGKKFDDADPLAVFNLAGEAEAEAAGVSEVKVKTKTAGSKTKTKLILYTAERSQTEQNATTGL